MFKSITLFFILTLITTNIYAQTKKGPPKEMPANAVFRDGDCFCPTQCTDASVAKFFSDPAAVAEAEARMGKGPVEALRQQYLPKASSGGK